MIFQNGEYKFDPLRATPPTLDVEQPELSYIAPGSVNWYNHSGKLFGLSTKTEQIYTLQTPTDHGVAVSNPT